MKHATLFRWLPWILIAVCPPMLGRCGGAAERDTENLVVPGAPRDEHEVTVSNGGGSQTAQARAQTSGDTADAGEGGPPGPCTDLRKTLAARVSAGFANVDNTCQRDEECVFISAGSGCYSRCPSLIASRSGARAAGEAVAQDIAPLCDEFDHQRCETPPLVCNAGFPVLVCNGTCTNVSTLSCDELPARAAARVTTLVNDALRSCSLDTDCVLAQANVRCVPSCGNLQSVAASAVADLQRSIAETEGLYCGSAESRGCPGQPQLPCMPLLETPRATCNAGQCEVTYVPLP